MESNLELIEKPKPVTLFVLVGVLVCLLLSACAAVIIWVSATTPKCGTGDSYIIDELRVREYAPGVFPSSDWNESFAIEPYRVTRTWIGKENGAITRLAYLLYNCGYSDADLATYYSEENFETVIFRDYQNPTRLATCSLGQHTLYIYSARFNDLEYVIHDWVTQDGKKHVLDLFMAFPADQQEQLTSYSEKLYPQLPSCQK